MEGEDIETPDVTKKGINRGNWEVIDMQGDKIRLLRVAIDHRGAW